MLTAAIAIWPWYFIEVVWKDSFPLLGWSVTLFFIIVPIIALWAEMDALSYWDKETADELRQRSMKNIAAVILEVFAVMFLVWISTYYEEHSVIQLVGIAFGVIWTVYILLKCREDESNGVQFRRNIILALGLILLGLALSLSTRFWFADVPGFAIAWYALLHFTYAIAGLRNDL